MRFMMLKDYPIEEIEFLRERYRVASSPVDEEIVYEVDESLREYTKVLEKAGLIKEIKPKGIVSIEKAGDIIQLTERVEILQGGKVYLRAFVAGHEFHFSEDELLTPYVLRKQLLRLKRVMSVDKKEWHEILQYWMDIGEDIEELSPEDEVVERVLNYLCDSCIYTNKEFAEMPYTLYYMKEEADRVFCCTDNLTERLDYTNRRKLRSILSDYIVSNSVQFQIRNQKKRFWAFSIEKCGIDMERQLYREGEQEENE